MSLPDKNTFYKYKTLDNFEFLLDLILKERLYAAKYDELNDPMEGVINVENTIPRDREIEWRDLIEKFRIVCFTKQSNNPLMWAHYADGGRGCIIEFELPNFIEYHKVSYVKKPLINKNDLTIDKALEVLKYKEKPWKYEAEYRCIVQKEKFLPIFVKSVTFGSRADEAKVDMLMYILKLSNPDLKVLKHCDSGSNLFQNVGLLSIYPRHFVKKGIDEHDYCEKCNDMKFAREHFRKL